MPQAAGQVKILLFLVKIKIFPYMPISFVMQGKCLFKDILRPVNAIFHCNIVYIILPISLTYVLCAQIDKNRLIETVLLSTHNIFFDYFLLIEK